MYILVFQISLSALIYLFDKYLRLGHFTFRMIISERRGHEKNYSESIILADG